MKMIGERLGAFFQQRIRQAARTSAGSIGVRTAAVGEGALAHLEPHVALGDRSRSRPTGPTCPAAVATAHLQRVAEAASW